MMQAALEQKRIRPRPGAALLLADASGKIALLPGPGSRLATIGSTITYELSSPNGYLATDVLEVNPLDYDYLVISGQLEGKDLPTEMEIAWEYLAPETGPAPAPARLSAHLENAGSIYQFDLSRQPRWILAQKIIRIQIFPGLPDGRFHLSSARLITTP
jgi:hypothetical protein